MTTVDPRTALVAELLGNPGIAHAVALYVGEGTFDRSRLSLKDRDWLDWTVSAVRVHGTEEDKELHDALRFSAL